MAKATIIYTQEGYNEVHNNLTTIKNETNAITKSKTKINIDNTDIQRAIKAQENLSKTLVDLQKSYDQLSNKSTNAAKRLKTEINGISNALKNFETAVEWSGKVSKTIQNVVGNQSSIRAINAQTNAEQKKNSVLKEQKKLLDDLDRKAKEVGQLTKGILQDKNLNQKGSKDTQAQWDYQVEAIRRTAAEIKNAKGAGEQYTHMLESMAYELKHTTGKSLFKDAEDGIKNLIKLENKRYEAQKSGKKIMEDYYNSEIKKQQELISQIGETANSPEKLQSLLKDNANYIKNLLPENMQEDFMNQVNKTGMLDNAWSKGMTEYVNQLKQAYTTQVKLNQAKTQQNTQDTSYKTLKADLQEIWNLENRIAQLSKDPKHHLSEIQYLQQVLSGKRQVLNYDERIKDLSQDQVTEIENAAKAQKQLNGQIQAQGKDWENNNKKVSEFGDTVKKVFNYILVYRGFQMLSQGIQQAIDTMKDLDKAFTDIQMVTGDSDEQTAQLAKDYNGLAREMGATTQEVAEGASEWLRQGKTAEETTELLRSSMTLSKVGAIESSEATELLTSSLNGYKIAAQDAMSVVDKISSIDLAAATSSYELATALARTANSANDAGVSFDKLLAMIGTVSSVTRKSASTIGESFKTIFARMSNVAAGKDTDDEGESLNDVEKTLNKMGIALRNTQGEWRSFEDVLDEVAEKWNNGVFNDVQQSQIATAIAGVRQQENFRALMNNYEEVGRLAQVAADSTGSATKRMETYLDSIEAKTNNLKAAWENFVMSLNQSESYKQLLEMLTNLLDTLQYVDWETISKVLILFGSLFIGSKIVGGISKTITALKAATGAAATLGITMSTLFPILILIAGAAAAIGIAWSSANNNINKQIDDIDKKVESIEKEKEAIEEDKKSVQDLYSEYQKLQSKQQLVGLNTEERQRMADITKELVEQYGFEYESVDSLTGGYILATDALTKYNEAKQEQLNQLDAEEKKEKISKAAKQVRNIDNVGMSFGFDQAGKELEEWGFFGSLGKEAQAYWHAFTGDKSEGSFFERYDNKLAELYKESNPEIEKEFENQWNDVLDSIMDIMSTTIEDSGLSDRFTTLFSAQIKAGLKNVDATKIKTEEGMTSLIESFENLLEQPEIKSVSDEIDRKLTEFETKVANKDAMMTLQDYKTYNDTLERQASLSITLLSNMIGVEKAQEIVADSLNEQMSNTGSYLALLSDNIKDEGVRKNFDNIANSIININKQLADGQIDVKNYFNLMKAEIESIDLSSIEDSFGNIGNYLATMGQISNSSGAQIQSIITSMQQGEKLNNEGVDDIKSYVGILNLVRNSAKKHMTDENGNYKILKDSEGNDYDSSELFEDTSATNQERVSKLNARRNSIQTEIDILEKALQGFQDIQEGKTPDFTTSQNPIVKDTDNPYSYRDVTPILPNSASNVYKMNADGTSELDKEATLQKRIEDTQEQINNLKEEDAELTEDIQEEQDKVNKGMDSYIEDMEDGVSYLDRYDWDSLDKASDTLFQGFADGALKANSTIDNVSDNYKNAALSMANAFVDMTSTSNDSFNALSENVQLQLQNISKETLEQIGLTSEATNVEIANAMLQSQSNFNAVVGAMNKNAQTALSEVLKGAGGMLEALGTAIESFSGEIKISIGGIKFNGLKTFASWDGGALFSSDSSPVETSIKFSGSGIDTKSLGAGIRDAGTALKENADTLASQWNPIQPNLLNKKTGGGKTGGVNNGGGSGSGSGSGYSAEDAADDLRDILDDIEDYEADIELDLEDQTEQLINHYNLEKNKLESLKEELDYYEGIYDSVENTTKWLETQQKLLENQSETVEALQKSNDKIDKQREKIYKENSKYKVSDWFDSEGNDTLAYGDLINSFEYQKNAIQKETAEKMRDIYNSVSGSTSESAIENAKERIEDLQDEADKRIEALDKEREKVENIHDSVSELNDAWDENQEAIRDALADMHDRIIDMRDTLVDQMMEQLEKAVNKQNESIEKDVTRMEQLVSIREKYYDILNETIDTQAELDSELQSSLDSFEYLDEQMRQLMFNEEDYKVLSETLTGIQEDIADIWEDHYAQIDSLTDDEMYKAEYITAETERQLEMKMQEYELAKAELDVAKARTNLQNVQNERNVRMFVNGQWSWVADPDAVKDAQQQLADAEREKDRIEREAEQQKLIDSMNKIIDSDNLQIDENNELLERVQEAIELQTQEVQSIEQALENIANTDLPAVGDVLQGVFGSDGKSGWISELLQNINKSTNGLMLALKGYNTTSAEKALKSGNLSKSDFEDLVESLGYSFNSSTGKVTTPEGSFSAHYKGWKKQSNSDTQLGTAENGVQVTGNGSSGGTSSGGSKANGFPRTGHVSTGSLPLRIRSGAGTNYKVLGLMPKGAKVTITGEANSGWAKVKYNGISGYASRQYLTYDQGGLATGKGVFLKDINVPERILSPKQTKSFDYLVKNLTTNPVLAALTKNPNVKSNLNGLDGAVGETKQYYFSNFTVQADNLTEFIDSLDAMIPISRK